MVKGLIKSLLKFSILNSSFSLFEEMTWVELFVISFKSKLSFVKNSLSEVFDSRVLESKFLKYQIFLKFKNYLEKIFELTNEVVSLLISQTFIGEIE